MVGYDEYENGYKIFYPSSYNTFAERSVQIEDELMQEVELAHGECSHPPLHDDVSDEYISDFYNSDIDKYANDIHSYHDSPIQPKWAEKNY